MSLGDLYPWLKALHVASAIVFLGGVLAVSVFLIAVARSGADDSVIAVPLRRWDQRVTSTAMLLTWSLGLLLAIGAGSFATVWLQAKLVVVLLLSAIHGAQSGKLRRLASGTRVEGTALGSLIVAGTPALAALAVSSLT